MTVLTDVQAAPIIGFINNLRARLLAATTSLNSNDVKNAQCNINGANWELSQILHAINDLEGKFGAPVISISTSVGVK